MKRLVLAALMSGLPPLHAAEAPAAAPDLLRFANGNQLDGHFAGLKPGPLLLWRRDDLAVPVEFKTDQLRQLVLRRGRPAKPLPGPSSVALVNGDRIPGTLVALDSARIVIDTPFAGPVTLPRDAVGMIAPNPAGGRILYTGPFSDDGWTIAGSPEPAAHPPEPPPDVAKKDLPGDGPAWSYAGSAWYNRQPSTALRRDVGMPDRAIIRFQLGWKNRLSLALAFHADFKAVGSPDNPEDGKRVQSGVQLFPNVFGNAYVLNLYPNYAILYRSTVDKDGKAELERVQAGGTNIRLPESGETRVELRCNRLTGEIALHLNDEFAMQWTEDGGDNGYAGKGGGIGFLSASAPIRFSDLVVAEWNGMPDSARSMQSDEQDILLLANGTDRFAGEVTGFDAGKLKLKSRYGEFQFPLDDIAEVRFARNKLAKAQPSAAGHARVFFHPIGSLSGTLEPGRDGQFTLATPLAGKLVIDPDYAVMIEFQNSKSFLDDWDPQF